MGELDEDLPEVGRSRCFACRRRLRVRVDAKSREPRAWAETDVDGRKRYWCRDCIESMYRAT